MISKIFNIIGSGLEQVRLNTHYLLVAVLIVVLPGAFIWVSQNSFETSYQNITTAEKQAVSLLHESIELSLRGKVRSEVLQNYLTGLVSGDNNITRARILKQVSSEIVIIHSAQTDEIGLVEGATQSYVSSAAVPGGSLIVPFTIDGTRAWQVFREVSFSEETYYIFTEHSFAAVDSVMIARQQQVYMALPVIFIFLMFLAYWLKKQTHWQKQYYVTKKKLDDQMLFTNSVAHELRAPLTAIRGYVSFLLESKSLAPEEKKYSQNINTAAERLIALINDFLEVARIQSGSLKVNFAEIDVRKVITSVKTEFEQVAAKKNLDFDITLPVDPVVASTDPDRLQQVLTNLVSNALKYTNKGSVTIALEQTRLKTTITIKDTGDGISAEDQEKLFTAFTRVGRADASGVTGTGLGMWITKQLVELLHGEVYIESIEGVGTHMKLTFDV